MSSVRYGGAWSDKDEKTEGFRGRLLTDVRKYSTSTDPHCHGSEILAKMVITRLA